MEEKKAKKQEIIETEIQMGTVHPAALEPYRVRFFVEDEIVKDAEITIGVNHRGIERIMEGLPVEKAQSRPYRRRKHRMKTEQRDPHRVKNCL